MSFVLVNHVCCFFEKAVQVDGSLKNLKPTAIAIASFSKKLIPDYDEAISKFQKKTVAIGFLSYLKNTKDLMSRAFFQKNNIYKISSSCFSIASNSAKYAAYVFSFGSKVLVEKFSKATLSMCCLFVAVDCSTSYNYDQSQSKNLQVFKRCLTIIEMLGIAYSVGTPLVMTNPPVYASIVVISNAANISNFSIGIFLWLKGANK